MQNIRKNLPDPIFIKVNPPDNIKARLEAIKNRNFKK
jgi:hypothetical protein